MEKINVDAINKIKLLENKSEFEILSQIMKKLEEIEKRLGEISCGNTSEQ